MGMDNDDSRRVGGDSMSREMNRIPCHHGVKITSQGLRVTLSWKNPVMANAMLNAADALAEGCVCQLVQDMFNHAFKELTEEIERTRKEKADEGEATEAERGPASSGSSSENAPGG